MINDKFDGKVLNWRKDPCGRIISLLVDLFDLRINLISIYTQVNPTERKSFFDNLHEYFIPSHSIIVGGDFNCYDSDLDKFGGNVSLATYLSEFKSSFKFVDIWRRLHRRSRQLTWFNADHTIGSRLDKFFLSLTLLKLPINVKSFHVVDQITILSIFASFLRT